MKPCIICGRIREIKVFCRQCYLKKYPLLDSFKPISLIRCSKCGSFLINNTWGKRSLENILPGLLKNKLKLNPELQNPKLDFKLTDVSIIVNVSGTVENVSVSEEYELPIEIKERTCSQCSKQRTSYYEAILQIRKPTAVLLYTIQHEIKKNNWDKYLNREAGVPNGIDFFFNSKKIAVELAKTLKKKLGGKLKFSKRIFTRDRQSSRDVYRVTIFYEHALRDNKQKE
jgi:NMD protein affecting ribosome stability and mRNA decay